ncbi:hypothetical protein [Xanthobacter sediminis]|uniref:hypothetical protein n=1 Tax=Xanthobacter sediminis TaxID=3119926 RepID=UPI00372627C6
MFILAHSGSADSSPSSSGPLRLDQRIAGAAEAVRGTCPAENQACRRLADTLQASKTIEIVNFALRRP